MALAIVQDAYVFGDVLMMQEPANLVRHERIALAVVGEAEDAVSSAIRSAPQPARGSFLHTLPESFFEKRDKPIGHVVECIEGSHAL